MGDQKYSAIYSRLNNIIQETGSDHNLYRFHVMGGRHNKADYSKGRETLSHLVPHIFREL